MAKENFAQLIGRVMNINKDDVNKVASFNMEVIRRNNRIDTPLVIVFESYYSKIIEIKNGDFVVVKGIVGTSEVVKTSVCPHCLKKVPEEALTTSVIMIDLVPLVGNYKLANFSEISNQVFLLGTLCRDIRLQILKSGIKNAQYQIAVNRKLRVKEQDRFSDYPFVSSLGEQAEQDFLRMEEGSQCFINGGLQTRKITRTRICPDCGNEFKETEDIVEVCPYNTEYLNNCKFDEEQ